MSDMFDFLKIKRRFYRAFSGMQPSSMSISYAITVCNEAQTLGALLSLLVTYLREQDEIVVQIDSVNGTEQVRDIVAKQASLCSQISTCEYAFNYDFAAAKNNLNNHCKGHYIFQLDADELPPVFLLQNMPLIIAANPKIELFKIPRNNILENADGTTTEQSSWPDYQGRLYRNRQGVLWQRPLHEKIQGHRTYVYLPQDLRYAIVHQKNRAHEKEKWEKWGNEIR